MFQAYLASLVFLAISPVAGAARDRRLHREGWPKQPDRVLRDLSCGLELHG